MRGLYIHIPFCQTICSYCDFPKRIPKDKKMIDDYLDQLKNEFTLYENYINNIDTIYIGGGTPSMLSVPHLEKLFIMLKPLTNIIEFTFECNPESMTLDKIKLLVKNKVSRVSIGVQTFNIDSLKLLNRNHSNQQVYTLIKNLKDHGINNINIDLMYAIPKSTIIDVKKDIDIALNLPISHISYYSFILEERTIVYNQYQNKKIDMISNDLEADMYELVISSLTNNGYIHYEISNFAKVGFASIHNCIYWKNEEYIGLGLGASGHLENIRYTNHHLINKYHPPYKRETLVLSLNDIISNEMILGLRLLTGVNIANINHKFKVNIFELFFIQKKIDEGLLIYDGGILRLSARGLLLANEVFVIFV